MLRVLHIGDASGIPYILAKYQNRSGLCRADVVTRALGLPHGIASYYGSDEWRRVPWRHSPVWRAGATRRIAVAARFEDILSRMAPGYDVLHVHGGGTEIVPVLRKKHPDKRIILHHHGDNLRGMDPSYRDEHDRHADKVLVSTPDLCEYGGHEWLPNPVDTDLFAPAGPPARNGRAVYFVIRDEPREVKLGLLRDAGAGLDCTVHDTNASPVPYPDMPAFLSGYEYYIDIKWLPIGKVMAALSTTGLQALAMGLKVVDHRYEKLEGLPDAHRPGRVVARLQGHYEG